VRVPALARRADREYSRRFTRLSGVTKARVLLVAALAVLAAAAPARAADETRVVVSGLARGQLVRLTPYVGLPGFGAQLGVAQAEVSGPAARASAGLADFGNLSLVLGALAGQVPVPLPALPAPVTADSQGTQEAVRDPLVANLSDGAQTPAGAREEVRAVPDPAARARVVGAGLNAADLLDVSGGESRATAVPGTTSTTVTLARLALGGADQPAVVLSDLVWTATQELGKPGTASFSLGSAHVQGEPVDVSGPDGLDALIKAANEALAGAGLYLEAPAVTTDLTGVAASALVVQLRNPEPVAEVLGTVTKPAGPVANQVLDAVITAFPDAEGARLVVNAVLANGSGRSGGRLELGGAAARLSAVELPAPDPVPAMDIPPSFSLPFPVGPIPAADIPAETAFPAPVPSGSFPVPGTGFVPAPVPLPATGPGDVPAEAPVGEPAFTALPALPPTTAGGGASAPLVLAGALVAVLALAGGDRLRLRKASP
jgi:hypothetical protein